MKPEKHPITGADAGASRRKRDHIELAFEAQLEAARVDARFWYEPMLAAMPDEDEPLPPVPFAGKELRLPIWVSSMTGGTELAHTINHNLARACREFGMGMGLGSCRSILRDKSRFADFDLREVAGPDVPLFANLGIAQVEQLLAQKAADRIEALVAELRADGLIVHVNPLQEWLQPEGDRITRPPLETIRHLLEATDVPLIVKEVGQGFGPASMEALMQLPLVAIDFGASGGTNFALLEMLRADEEARTAWMALARVGHTAEQMVHMANRLADTLGARLRCRQLIISGGISSFLDGYYLTGLSRLPALYGQASAFLRHARGDYETLRRHVQRQADGLRLARRFLRIRRPEPPC